MTLSRVFPRRLAAGRNTAQGGRCRGSSNRVPVIRAGARSERGCLWDAPGRLHPSGFQPCWSRCRGTQASRDPARGDTDHAISTVAGDAHGGPPGKQIRPAPLSAVRARPRIPRRCNCSPQQNLAHLEDVIAVLLCRSGKRPGKMLPQAAVSSLSDLCRLTGLAEQEHRCRSTCVSWRQASGR